MKVLQVNITANWGSTGKIAEHIGLKAISHGWKCWMAFGRYSNPTELQLIDLGSRWNTYHHYFVQRVLDNEGLCSKGATRKLIAELKRIQPNVVHLHNIHDHYLNYELLFEYLNSTDIKVLWTFHDFWAVTGHCMHFVTKNCNLYETGCHDCPMRKVFPKTLMDRSRKNWELKRRLFSANKNLTIVPVSEWVGEMTRKSFLKDKPIRVIPNGIDVEVFKPTLFPDISNLSEQLRSFQNQTYGKFVIMSVATQWKNDKGVEDYKRIAKMLKKDEVIVLVGVDDVTMKDLPENVIGIKRTTNVQELAALYTRADVVTTLSSAETFGLTVVEGYACGTPAVVYNNTALPALVLSDGFKSLNGSIIEGPTGFVVEDKNYMAAYEAYMKIKARGKSHYSDACIFFAREKYDKDKCYEEYVKLYEEVVGK